LLAPDKLEARDVVVIEIIDPHARAKAGNSRRLFLLLDGSFPRSLVIVMKIESPRIRPTDTASRRGFRTSKCLFK
jgi:hypothetical protein